MTRQTMSVDVPCWIGKEEEDEEEKVHIQEIRWRLESVFLFPGCLPACSSRICVNKSAGRLVTSPETQR